MPLVRTPMIAPTKIYDSFPTITPDEAADLICEAIRAKPKQINTRLGTFGEVAYALAPKAVDQILHMAYKVFPDSAAAKGEKDADRAGLGRADRARAPDARRALVDGCSVTPWGPAHQGRPHASEVPAYRVLPPVSAARVGAAKRPQGSKLGVQAPPERYPGRTLTSKGEQCDGPFVGPPRWASCWRSASEPLPVAATTRAAAEAMSKEPAPEPPSRASRAAS